MKHVEGGLKRKDEGPNKQREALGEVVICRGFRMWPQIVSKSPQNHLKVTSKLYQESHNHLETISEFESKWCRESRNSLSLAPRWPLSGPSLVPRWSLSGPLLAPLWTLAGPSLAPRWPLSGSSLVPVSGLSRVALKSLSGPSLSPL